MTKSHTPDDSLMDAPSARGAAASPAPRRELLFSMKRLRAIEEMIAEKYHEQAMRCPVHLATGQEAVSAGIGLNLRADDFAVSGHRAHIHYLAKGGDLKRMIAEIYGKRAGCSSGKGGSMHLIDESVGFKGSTAIVAGTIPVGVGLGLSISLGKTDQISVVFLGDAAVEEGVFYESVNFAVLRKLPVLFICENNLYSTYSPLSVRQPAGRAIHEMTKGVGIESSWHDGNDAVGVYEAFRAAVASIRRGEGPRFMEFATYRWREHCGPNFDNHIGYRTEAEFLSWKERDPIAGLENAMKKEGVLSDAQIAAMDQTIDAEAREAFAFAENAPFPDPSEASSDVHAGEAK